MAELDKGYFQKGHSEQFIFVSDALAQEKISDLELRLTKFFEFIDSPPSLKRLSLANENLPHIYNFLKHTCAPKPWKWVLLETRRHQNIWDALTKHRKALSAAPYDFDKELGKDRNKNFHGLISDYPLYSILGHGPEQKKTKPPRRKIYLQLLSHLLTAVLVLKRANQFENFASSNQGKAALKAIRVVAHEDNRKDYNGLPRQALPLDQYCCAIKRLPKNHLGRKFLKLLQEAVDINNNLASLWELKDFQDEDSISVVTNVHPRRDKSEGDEPEIEQGKDIVEVPQPDTGDQKANRQIKIASAQQAQNRIQSDNQLFCFAWSNLNQLDIRCLTDHLINEPPKNLPQEEWITAKALLGIMLFCGQPYEKAINTKIRFIEADQEDLLEIPFDGQASLFISNEVFALRLPSKGPDLVQDYSKFQVEQSHLTKKHIELRLPNLLRKILQSHISRLDNTCSPEAYSLFNTEDDLKLIANTFISKINKQHKTRLTLNRIANYLPKAVARLKGSDIAASQLIFGTENSLANTRVHYTSLSSQYLGNLYFKACQELLVEAGRKLEGHLPLHQDKNLGSPIRPTESHLKKVISGLHADLGGNRQISKITREQVAIFHNRFACYSALMLVIAGAFRSSKKPLVPARDIVFSKGFMVLRDKDTADEYHVRMLHLPDLVKEQLLEYQKHLNLIHDQYFGSSLGIDKIYSKGRQFDRITSFFLIDENFQAQFLDSSTLAQSLREYEHTLPPNTQRHFMKSTLQEKSCCIEAIETLLGHWSSGQEPFSRTSSLSPGSYRREINQHIVPLLKSLGFVKVGGLEK